jgi:hypothetical protein
MRRTTIQVTALSEGLQMSLSSPMTSSLRILEASKTTIELAKLLAQAPMPRFASAFTSRQELREL